MSSAADSISAWQSRSVMALIASRSRMRSVVEAGGTRNSERKRNPLLRSYVVFHGRQIRLPVRLMMSGARSAAGQFGGPASAFCRSVGRTPSPNNNKTRQRWKSPISNLELERIFGQAWIIGRPRRRDRQVMTPVELCWKCFCRKVASRAAQATPSIVSG